MPNFEAVIAFKKMTDSGLREALKRCAGYIFEVGGTLRKMENLGERNLPYVIKSAGKSHRIAHFFIFTFDTGARQPNTVEKKFRLDLDIVRAVCWLKYFDPIDMHQEKEKEECTHEVDLLPPPYRPNVIALQKMAEEKKNKKPRPKNTDDTDFLIY